MDLKRIQDLVRSVLPQEQKATEHKLLQIQEGLKRAGFAVSERTLYRQLKGLGIRQNAGGFYGDPDVVLLLGWNQRRSQFSSYARFFQAEGARLYEIAQVQLSA
jgi:hypothetical protein